MWLRILGGTLAVLTFGVAVLAGVVVALDRSLTRVDVEGLAGGQPTVVDDHDTNSDGTADLDQASSVEVEIDTNAPPITVLVLGSDTREVLTPEERDEYGTGMAWGERTEVVALVRVDRDAGELRMVNIPRDSVVTRCDGSVGRINAAYGIGDRTGTGGVTCVVQTVSAWSGVDIDHAVKVDFRGFVDIVNAIGGVEMFIQEPLRDRRANLDLAAGCQVLDGADALAFVRARGIDNDFGRISRQQRLLVEMRDQVAEDGWFSEPVRLLRLAEAVAGSMEVDRSLTLNRIRNLVMGHRSTLQRPLDARTVSGTPDTSGDAWLLRVDEEDAAELFRWLIEGDPDPAPSAPGDPDVEVDASDPDQERTTTGTGGDGADADRAEDDAPAGSIPQRCD